jgi:hypothetical protein
LDEHIADLAKHDKDSYAFRYTLDLKGRPALPRSLTHIDTVQLREVSTRLAAILDGISVNLNDALQARYEYLAEMQEEAMEYEAELEAEYEPEDW